MPTAAAVFKPRVRIGTLQVCSYDRQRLSSARRGYGGKRWAAKRRRVFVRDLWTCQACGLICLEKSEDEALWPECDHVIPKRDGGSDDLNNLQTLHKSCHSSKTGRERGGRGVKS